MKKHNKIKNIMIKYVIIYAYLSYLFLFLWTFKANHIYQKLISHPYWHKVMIVLLAKMLLNRLIMHAETLDFLV